MAVDVDNFKYICVTRAQQVTVGRVVNLMATTA